jgi:hypothetical protein
MVERQDQDLQTTPKESQSQVIGVETVNNESNIGNQHVNLIKRTSS